MSKILLERMPKVIAVRFTMLFILLIANGDERLHGDYDMERKVRVRLE